MSFDAAARIGEIARRILGEPNKAHSTRNQLRFGAHGSVAVEIGGEKPGTWFDHENKIGGGARDLIRIKHGIPEPDIDAWLEQEFGALPNGRKNPRRIVKTYGYRERGQLVYQVVRYEPKAFRQRRPGPRGEWIYDLKGVRRILYRLDELRAAPAAARVYIVEGEKDADNLAGLGCVATCNSEGVGKWRPHFAAEFRDRHVTIIPDGDEAGRKHAVAVAANLAPLARSVRILELPGLPPKGDVSDWLAAGGTRDRLEALAAEAPVYRPASVSEGALQLVGFDDMRPRLADGYLIKGLLPAGGMAVVYGDSGTGKTFLTLHLALCIAAGAECFGHRVRRAGVVYVAAEAGRSIQNRVAAAKHEIEFPETMPFAAVMAPLDLCSGLDDAGRLVAAIRETDLGSPIELVIIDTLSRTMGAGNENAPEDMGAFVRSVDELRTQLGAAVMIVHHSGKDASRGARGHSLLRAATDTEIEVSRDPGGSRIAVARVTKQRDGIGDGELQFTLRVIELGTDSDGELVTSCVVEEVAEPHRSPRPARLSPQQQTALDLLKRAIEECGEPPPASSHIPENRVAVTEETWRRYCYAGAISPDGEQPAKQKAFRRSAEALLAAGRIGKWNEWLWLV